MLCATIAYALSQSLNRLSYLEGLKASILTQDFMINLALCVREGFGRQCICAGSPDLFLLAYVIAIKSHELAKIINK